MKKTIVLIFIIILGISFIYSSETTKKEDFFKRIDNLFEMRKDVSNLKKGIALLENYVKKNQSYDAYWRLAKFYYQYGERVPKNKRKNIFFKAVNYGRRALLYNKNRVEGHFWLGVAYGKYGEAKGIFKSLSLVKPIKQEMKRVIELDENYECGGAYRVLGRLYFKVPGIMGGSKSKSLEYLLKEKKMCPSNILGRYYLADTLRKVGKKKEAIAELEYILNLKVVDPRWAPEYDLVRKDAEKLYKKLK